MKKIFQKKEKKRKIPIFYFNKLQYFLKSEQDTNNNLKTLYR